MRITVSIFAFLTLLVVGCKRDSESYNFDDASEEARQAIAGNVEFTLDESTFQKWERAQANLDKLPPGELDKTTDPGGNDPVTRGIRRLESNPRARRAIESTGLSVKNFVLATVALAQAVKASQGGVPPTVGAVAANVRFVMAHASRLRSRGAASVWVPPAELSEEEIAAQEAMKAEAQANPDEVATGAELGTPTVPPLDDWTRNQPQPTQPLPQPRPRDAQRNTGQTNPQVLTPPPPTRDTSTSETVPPPKTDSLPIRVPPRS